MPTAAGDSVITRAVREMSSRRAIWPATVRSATSSMIVYSSCARWRSGGASARVRFRPVRRGSGSARGAPSPAEALEEDGHKARRLAAPLQEGGYSTRRLSPKETIPGSSAASVQRRNCSGWRSRGSRRLCSSGAPALTTSTQAPSAAAATSANDPASKRPLAKPPLRQQVAPCLHSVPLLCVLEPSAIARRAL